MYDLGRVKLPVIPKKAYAADPARTLGLLWGSHGKAGRSGLTLAAIVEKAVEIADADGFDAVSMRVLAESLQVGAMSLYTHVPGKADLTALMIDAVYGELYESVEAPSQQPGGWRGAAAFVARRNWELLERHPWLLQANHGRPPIGPNLVRKYEAELRPFDGLGLNDVEIDSVLVTILMHVDGVARTQASIAKDRSETGLSDDQWWLAHEPILARAIDPDQFPTASRVGKASSIAYEGVFSPTHALEFGLERILDGIELLLTKPR
ncbi:TetR/AcrR family transcriptional regulator [bacterium]|nr:MAG: TetR/AcrR family transcriptional regulator [bacterium]